MGEKKNWAGSLTELRFRGLIKIIRGLNSFSFLFYNSNTMTRKMEPLTKRRRGRVPARLEDTQTALSALRVGDRLEKDQVRVERVRPRERSATPERELTEKRVEKLQDMVFKERDMVVRESAARRRAEESLEYYKEDRERLVNELAEERIDSNGERGARRHAEKQNEYHKELNEGLMAEKEQLERTVAFEQTCKDIERKNRMKLELENEQLKKENEQLKRGHAPLSDDKIRSENLCQDDEVEEVDSSSEDDSSSSSEEDS